MQVNLGYERELEGFRRDIREWIAGNAPAGLNSIADWNALSLGAAAVEQEVAADHPLFREWEERLLAARLVCPQWPSDCGGSGFTPAQMSALNEELYSAGLPRVQRGMGESLVGPAVIVHGTSAQRSYFLPRILSGQDRYCQGFSEPDHGSDLAGITTRGQIEGDEIVITGEKVWTSRAADANMIFVLCRTDIVARKHEGLSYVLVPMPDNGIRIAPIRDMTGSDYFCQEYLSDTRAPIGNIIGGINNGWQVALTTLGHERGGTATTQHLRHEREFWDVVGMARCHGKESDPVVRQKLAKAFSEVAIMRYSGMRLLGALAQGDDPGPDSSLAKLYWSEYHKTLTEFAMDICGPQAMILPDRHGYPTSGLQDTFLWARAGTIYSGTSEIQRKVIAERWLGLPREPGVG